MQYVTYIYYDKDTFVVQSILKQILNDDCNPSLGIVYNQPPNTIGAVSTDKYDFDYNHDLAHKIYKFVDNKMTVTDKPIDTSQPAPDLEARVSAVEKAVLGLI